MKTLILLLAASVAWAQPTLTTIQDVLYRADSTTQKFNGRIIITWQDFVQNGAQVRAGTKTLTIRNGVVNTTLVPNDNATPSGTTYRVKYDLDFGVDREVSWTVPTSVSPVTIATIEGPATVLISAPGIFSLNGLSGTAQTLAKVNDTNVTLAWSSASSTHTLTAGWTGQLPVSRGGSGAATLTGVLKGNGTSPFTAATYSDVVSLWSGCTGFLKNDGTCASAGAGTPAGSNKQIQYNNSGAFGAEAGFEYDPATNTLSVDKITTTGPATEFGMPCLAADPSAPSTDRISIYCLNTNQRLKYYPEGGSATYIADGNSSGEATKGVAGAYDATSWNGSSETPTKDAVRDKIESMSSGGASTLSFSYPPVQDGAGWRSSTLAPFSGDNNAVGYYNWNETDGSKYALVKGIVPAGWTSGAVTAYITFQGSGSGNAIQWKVSESCDQGDTFSTADNFSSQTTSGSTRYRLSKTLTLTGCSATNSIIYKIQRVDTNGVGYIFAFDVTYAIP